MEKIKKLAKKCLDEKWYKILEGDESISLTHPCAFCEDIDVKGRQLAFQNDETSLDDICEGCLCPEILCGYASYCPNIQIVVKGLEMLVKDGKLSEIFIEKLKELEGEVE